jgi:SAM-dependent methyltransferase
MRILNLACGPGTLTRPLAALVSPGGEVVGVDLAPGMIEHARRAGIANARFELMDMEHLTFPDGTFDAAVCGHGLQFAGDLGAALHEARRVLHAAATFAASAPVTPVKDSVWAMLDTVIDRWLPPPPKALDQDGARSVVTNPDAFKQAALDAGFGSAHVEVVEEMVHWESAEQLVSMFTSWWDCAARLDGVGAETRRAFIEEATDRLEREHPGTIDTFGRNHVLLAEV